MRFTVAYIKPSGFVRKHPMRSCQSAAERIVFRPISAIAIAEHRRNQAAADVYHADDVVFGVGDIETTVVVGKSLRTA